jgi:hypothetical protein
MKSALILCTLVVGLLLATPAAEAQSCPYTVSITSYGSSCSNLAGPLPSLVALPPSGSCDTTFFHLVPFGSVPLTNRWFVVGLSPTSLALPGGGCSLLVTPLIIVDLPALEGTIAPLLLLPSTTALIGISVYAQGIDRRFDAGAGTQHFETTNGVRLDLL